MGLERSSLTLALLLSCVCAHVLAGVSKAAVAQVSCQVCRLAVREASRYAKNKGLTGEEEVADLLDHLCSVAKKEGRWLSKFDITHGEDGLILTEQSEYGVCRKECSIIQRACSGVVQSDLVEMLLRSAGEEDLEQRYCKRTCKRTLPKMETWADEAFEARNAKDLELEDMGMKMYKRSDGSLSSLSHGARAAAAAALGEL
eukprot:TRINITY_DN43926_c0_g1_i1.p1 TRINITY_DN43926_c0_g1~~TRINITY_DN43926_c0_g1_i1.p1  ORF type:complete len:201 (-),score=47.96 TRINITY_DN43926_c0_g1_i1:54-656(-)